MSMSSATLVLAYQDPGSVASNSTFTLKLGRQAFVYLSSTTTNTLSELNGGSQVYLQYDNLYRLRAPIISEQCAGLKLRVRFTVETSHSGDIHLQHVHLEPASPWRDGRTLVTSPPSSTTPHPSESSELVHQVTEVLLLRRRAVKIVGNILLHSVTFPGTLLVTFQ
ncbi:hypothetical protein BC629DRAFT_613004 [Irpex lacteus]|nr:hypothetical protein BC629DRAFT_613004 [Irpex lacteus]